jgi:hypothetical protein
VSTDTYNALILWLPGLDSRTLLSCRVRRSCATWTIELPRALPRKTRAVTIARETRSDSPSQVLNQHPAPGQLLSPGRIGFRKADAGTAQSDQTPSTRPVFAFAVTVQG